MNTDWRNYAGAFFTALIFLCMAAGCFLDPGIRREQMRRQALDSYAQGEELERKGEYARALECYLKSIEISPRPASYYHAGRCHARLGHSREALDYFDRALAAAPDYDLARAERDLVARQMEAASASVPGASPTPVAAVNALTPVSPPPAPPTSSPPPVSLAQSASSAQPSPQSDDKSKEITKNSRSYRPAIFPELVQTEASGPLSSSASGPPSASSSAPPSALSSAPPSAPRR